MSVEFRVWIRARKCRKRTTFHVRWVDPVRRCWRSRKIGTDRKLAERERVKLEMELADGSHVDLKNINWPTFVDEVTALMDGTHRAQCRHILDEFGSVVRATSPRTVRQSTIKTYVEHLRTLGHDAEQEGQRKNCTATINKKLRHLRAVFNTGIRLEYLAKNPLDGWNWQKVKRGSLRILSHDEELKMLASAERLYGFPMRMLLVFALETWGRMGEITGLLWEDVRFDDKSVVFRDTKSFEDRFVPIAESSDLLDDLRRLQASTLQDGGPFVAQAQRTTTTDRRLAIVKDAEIPHFTYHDLRRTGITRALLAGVPPITVQRLAGHRNIGTTMRYYAQVDNQDLRDGVEKMRAAG
ncbi:MAG: site-specific integrase [Planctomycetes bacterium]|nr:site-specific integrase [Planctomycetota bacterium]